MTATNSSAACSARQEIGEKTGLIVCRVLLVACCMFIAGFDEKTEGHTAKRETVPTDTLAKPKVTIKVNRHYDEHGNVVGVDSTYTSFYSNISGDPVTMDTLMKGFDNYFKFHHPSIFQKEFSPLFFADSLGYPDFFHNDFFMKRYELNDSFMRDVMQRLDSIKNRYFDERSKPPQKRKAL